MNIRRASSENAENPCSEAISAQFSHESLKRHQRLPSIRRLMQITN